MEVCWLNGKIKKGGKKIKFVPVHIESSEGVKE